MSFFVAGGTVPPGSPSYVERAADRELHDALLAGEYCFVLNSRQMGKSSLAVRTIARLCEAGVRTAFVDLTRVGGATVTPEQWYSGLLLETGRALGLRAEASVWLKAHRGVGPAQRLLSFLQEEVLSQIDGPVVLMLDEIDAVRSLGFSTDELFAGLRQLHNGRASESALKRLTFCLLGAALPSDLIRDPRVTPFNVGRRVELKDFTPEEARPFAAALGEGRLARLLGWTGGHPFLTQALGAELAADPARDVDALVRERYLDARARESDTNLADVGRRLLGEGDPDVGDEDRATTLALYGRMLRGKPVADDEANPAAARIKMSGVARVEGGQLRVRSRIYAQAFDARWVREVMPGQELRRQRRAFWRGVLRTGIVAAAVVAVVSTLAVIATDNARVAKRSEARATRAEALAQSQRDAARYDAYVASMQTMLPNAEGGDGETARRTLDALRDDPNCGWEYAYWRNAIDGGSKTLDWRGDGVPNIAADPRGAWLGVADFDSLTVYDLQGRRRAHVSLPHAEAPGYAIFAFRSGDRFLLQNLDTRLALVVDAPTGRVLRRRRLKGFVSGGVDWVSPGDRTTLTVSPSSFRPYRLDPGALEETPLGFMPPLTDATFSPRTNRASLAETQGNGFRFSVWRTSDWRRIWSTGSMTVPQGTDFDQVGASVTVIDGGTLRRLDATTGRLIDSTPLSGTVNAVQFSPDGQRLLVTRLGEKARELSVADHLRPVRDFYDPTAIYAAGGRLLTAGNRVRLRDLGLPAATTRVLPSGANTGAYRVGGRVGFYGAKGVFEIDANAPLRAPVPRPKLLFASGGDYTGRYIRLIVGGKVVEFKDTMGVYPPLRIPVPDMYNWGEAATNPRGDRLAYSSDSTHLAVYDMRTGRRIASLSGVSGSTMPRFSDDGRWLAVGDHAGNVGVWNASTWRRVAKGHMGQGSVRCLAFSPDGAWLAAGSWSGDVGTLDLLTGAVRRFDGVSQSVDDVAWSPDGRRLASGGSDREVRLWDAATGRDLGAIGRHDAEVAAVWFTRNGRTLCSIDAGGTLKLWTTGERP